MRCSRCRDGALLYSSGTRELLHPSYCDLPFEGHICRYIVDATARHKVRYRRKRLGIRVYVSPREPVSETCNASGPEMTVKSPKQNMHASRYDSS